LFSLKDPENMTVTHMRLSLQ